MIKPPRFNIGDRVYHITPESPEGIVIDAKYSLLTQSWEYQVTFGPFSSSLWYYDVELIEHRTFNSSSYNNVEG